MKSADASVHRSDFFERWLDRSETRSLRGEIRCPLADDGERLHILAARALPTGVPHSRPPQYARTCVRHCVAELQSREIPREAGLLATRQKMAYGCGL